MGYDSLIDLKKSIKPAFLAMIFFCAHLYAQDNVVKLSDLPPPPPEGIGAPPPPPPPSEVTAVQSKGKVFKNKEFEEDFKLTDPLLRAQDGSLSRYSINTSLMFQGPNFANPTASELPNPDKMVMNTSQKLSGSISARYRLDSDDSLSFGSGLTLNHPLQTVDRTDVDNPFIGYNRAYRIKGLQAFAAASLAYATVPNFVNIGQIFSCALMNSMVYNLGRSRFAMSFETTMMVPIYSRGYNAGSFPPGPPPSAPPTSFQGPPPANLGDGNAPQFMLSVGPGLKYRLGEHWDLSSGIDVSYENPRSANDVSVLKTNLLRSRVALGYSYGRDIFISPSVEMFPTMLTPENTTLNIATIFSLL